MPALVLSNGSCNIMFLNSLYLSNISDVSGLISKVKERKYIVRILNVVGSIEINILLLWVEDSTIAVCNMFFLTTNLRV